MASRRVYFITEAEDKEEARANVESFLFDYLHREFYEGYAVSDTDVKRVRELGLGFFEEALCASDKLAALYEDEIGCLKQEGDLFRAGYAHVCLGNVLMRSFCLDMPFWNLLTDGWELPDPDDWAVAVELE